MAVNRKRGSAAATFFKFLFVLVCIVGAIAAIVLVRAVHKGKGESTGGDSSWIQAIKDAGQVVGDPRAGFPNKHKLYILCMGIDDNWTDSDVMYTAGARTDTLFLLTVDLDTKKITMLSIPRDSYVPIAGTSHSDKINAAYASGGPKRCMATVANLLGVQPDSYILLKIDATKNLVNALGGVDVNVEHPLDYDDNWGHLHVHLKPGFQHLDGDDAVGFARYRHGNHGVTPEDGDERRIYRQHVLMRAMVERMKSISNLIKPDALVDTGMQQIETDLTRTQMLDLAVMFHKVQQTDIETAQLPGSDGKSKNGAYVMLLDPDAVQHYTDWLVRGDQTASYALIPVIVKNGTTTRGLAASAVQSLSTAGFTESKVGGNAKTQTVVQTEIIDSGVVNHNAAAQLAALIGEPNAQIIAQPVQPNHLGWTPTPTLTVVLGADYAAHSSSPTAAGTAASATTAGV